MTNEEILGVAEILERATNRFNEQAARFRERSAAYDRLIAEMSADHEAKMAELGARTSADAKIIEGLRAAADEQVLSASKVAYVLRCAGETPVQAAQRVVKERDGLLTQVQDMRAEITRLTGNYDLLRREYDKALTLCETDEQTPAECIGSLNARIDRLQDDARSDAKVREDLHRINVELQAEVAARRPKYKVGDKLESYSSAVTIVGVRTVYDCQTDGAEYPVGHSEDELKRRYEQTPKQHPVKVGEWVRRISLPGRQSPVGVVKQVTSIRGDGDSYGFADEDYWAFRYCEPCDQPATHDTEAGKAAAESAVKTEPVAEPIKVGDVAKVVGASGDLTAQSDIGKIGEVLKIDFEDGTVLLSGGAGWVNRCDVRKVTT